MGHPERLPLPQALKAQVSVSHYAQYNLASSMQQKSSMLAAVRRSHSTALHMSAMSCLRLSLACCPLAYAQYNGRIRDTFYCDYCAIANVTICTQSQLFSHHLVPLSVPVKQKKQCLRKRPVQCLQPSELQVSNHLDLFVGCLQEESSVECFLKRLWLPLLQLYAALPCNSASTLLLVDCKVSTTCLFPCRYLIFCALHTWYHQSCLGLSGVCT